MGTTTAGEERAISRKPHRRHLILGALAVVVCAAVAYGLLKIFRGEFRWDVFLATFRSLDLYWFLAASVLMFLTYAVRAFRWRIMIRPLGAGGRIGPLITATIIGFTAVTLFGRPGEVVRPYLIATREKLPFSSQIAAWILERVYDLLMVLLIFGFALAKMPGDRPGLGPALEWALRTGGYVAAAVGALCVTILVASAKFSDTTRQRLVDALAFLPPGAHRKAETVVHAFTSGMACSRSSRHVAQLLSWSLVEWFLIAASTLSLFRSFPETAHFGWIESLIFLGFVAFGSIVQIPGIGGGLQVAGVVVLTRLFGLDLESATSISIMFWFIGFVLVIPFGFALMVHEGVRLKSLRQISEAELADPEAAGTRP